MQKKHNTSYLNDAHSATIVSTKQRNQAVSEPKIAIYHQQRQKGSLSASPFFLNVFIGVCTAIGVYQIVTTSTYTVILAMIGLMGGLVLRGPAPSR